ncbi:Transcriptional regulatory protein sin3 [Phlyctochytrium planicorne]|nr:Transcriptional regulatory protein sin3 [Phlyctochytrium planicorne]
MNEGPGGPPPPRDSEYPRMYPDYHQPPSNAHPQSIPPHQQGGHVPMQPPHMQHGPPPPPHMSQPPSNGMMQGSQPPPSHTPHPVHHSSMGHMQHSSTIPAAGPPPAPPHHSMGSGAAAPISQSPATVTVTASGPPPPAGSYDQSRPLNVKDALTYLDQVKIQFQDYPMVYNQFLDIMKDFKSQAIDTPGVIDRVSNLFRGYPNLINGFNTFLPPGYRLEAPANPKDPVRVTTPQSAATALHTGGHPYTEIGGSSGGPHPVYYSAQSSSQPVYAPVPTPPPGSGATHSPPYPHVQPPHGHHSVPHSQGPSSVAGSQAAQASPPSTHTQPQAPPAPPAYSGSGGAGGQGGAGSTPPAQPAAITAAASSAAGGAGTPNRKAPVEFNHAINYVNKIKNRFTAEPETYKQFLEILQTYQKEQRPIQEVYGQVQVLFKNAPDLLDEFKQFLPDTSAQPAQGGRAPQNGGRMPPIGNFMSSTDRRSGAGTVKTMKRSTSAVASSQPSQSGTSSKKRAKASGASGDRLPGQATNGAGANAQSPLPRPDTIEELEWIDRCKRTIGNKAAYTEFLKVLNLFSQEIIDAKTLVERVEPFLSRAPDLFDWFKKFVKYEEDVVIVNAPAERPEVDLRTCRKTGHSYRLLPNHVPRATCSGRDDIAREVLNDDWISQPEYLSETGFVAHKKTQYEEALHKCEEERYEFDINIEANLHTIALLEPIYRKIQTMSADEKAKFKLPPGLGGQSTTIYQRVIKKIYDKDKGQEVIEALHNNPAVAVPVVLKRLKQKDEEWKRAQRDWNKVWREIDAKNYYKALDHQGITFKASDRKVMGTKSLVAEIENIYREQREKRALLTNGSSLPGFNNVPLTRYQIEQRFKDPEIFRDVRRLIMGQVTNTQSISQSDEDRIGEFLATFVRRFFFVENVDDLVDEEEADGDADDSAMDVDDASSTQNVDSPQTSPAENQHSSSNGLRKDLLVRRAEVGGLVGNAKKAAAGGGDQTDDESGAVASADEGASGADKKKAVANGQKSTSPRKRRATYSFYANTSFYSFFRLYQMLYSRLLKMKEIAQYLADNPPRAEILNPVAIELGIQTTERAPDSIIPTVKDRYAGLLRAIHDFFGSKMEAQEFEDRCRALFGTSGYIMFTVDKLIQHIVKQIQAIQADPKGHDLVELYFKDRDKPSTSSRQEAVYRLSAEGLIQDENIFRLEYYVRERALTIQLLSKDDTLVDDSISSEEKWSLYVDQYIQLSATEGVRLRHRPGPFLRRNHPSRVPDDPPTDVETRSGLELKICLNTYKIFFVENTEDYFRRRRAPPTASAVEARKQQTESSATKFRSWVEERGKEIVEEEKRKAEEEEKAAKEAKEKEDKRKKVAEEAAAAAAAAAAAKVKADAAAAKAKEDAAAAAAAAAAAPPAAAAAEVKAEETEAMQVDGEEGEAKESGEVAKVEETKGADGAGKEEGEVEKDVDAMVTDS